MLPSPGVVGVTTAGARSAGDFFGGVAVVRVAPLFFAAAGGAADDATEIAAALMIAAATEVGGGEEGSYSSSLLLSVEALLLALCGESDRWCVCVGERQHVVHVQGEI